MNLLIVEEFIAQKIRAMNHRIHAGLGRLMIWEMRRKDRFFPREKQSGEKGVGAQTKGKPSTSREGDEGVRTEGKQATPPSPKDEEEREAH